ncbi:E3 ubiquitin-protein ligase RHA2A [Ziziphus jujuba]|uniref:E3 ubiquitin-protein ligase RHA2A n=1 Tax=Ziziphus jujuba TaxID=326968 RepID=A0A6P6FYQ4_ZIZJJ|nr:E3 ubiquitin-protein ligase RHA2A [Ziziphus jujuba]
MGLHSQLNDVSSDSIPLLMVALIANCVNYLRSFLFGLLHSLGLSRFGSDDHVDDGLFGAVGSGLAGLIVLADQLNLNRLFSYRYSIVDSGADGSCSSDCVVCLCTLKDGDQVRMLACRHVFHKHCFDGWLDHLNFNCPLCRSPLVSDERVSVTRQRVGGDLVAWFSAQ